MVVLPVTIEEILRQSRRPSETMQAQRESVEDLATSLQKTETTRASDLASETARSWLKSVEALRIALQPSQSELALLKSLEGFCTSLQLSETERLWLEAEESARKYWESGETIRRQLQEYGHS